jgi:hypothetical protein
MAVNTQKKRSICIERVICGMERGKNFLPKGFLWCAPHIYLLELSLLYERLVSMSTRCLYIASVNDWFSFALSIVQLFSITFTYFYLHELVLLQVFYN